MFERLMKWLASRRRPPTVPVPPQESVDRNERSDRAIRHIAPHVEHRDGWSYFYAPTKVVYHGCAGARMATRSSRERNVAVGDIQYPSNEGWAAV